MTLTTVLCRKNVFILLVLVSRKRLMCCLCFTFGSFYLHICQTVLADLNKIGTIT